MRKTVITVIAVFFIIGFGFNNSMAQQIGFNGIGGRLGLVNSGGSTIIFGVHADLGEIIENLKLFPSVDYWTKSSNNVFSINANVRYYFPTDGNIDFFAGGGLGFVRWSWDGVGTVGTVSSTDFGLNILGGADFPVGDKLVATAKIIFNTHADQLKIMGGITYLLGETQ